MKRTVKIKKIKMVEKTKPIIPIKKIKSIPSIKPIEIKKTSAPTTGRELVSQDILELDYGDEKISPKALRVSREFKEDFHRKFGQNISSILQYDRKIQHTDISRVDRGGGYAHTQKKNKDKFSETFSILAKTGFTARNRTNYLSTFPMNVGRVMVGMYAPDECDVYDPFAGHNSRMELCFTMGHNYTGVDICKEFMDDNKKIKEYLIGNASKNLLQPKKPRNITLLEQSSASVPNLADNSFDFTITSPPYWDIENYGPEEEQLGTGKTYEQFLTGLQLCANENFRVLKPGAFTCWFVNDFRKNRKFYPYHIDTYNILESAGFDPFNIYIVDLMNTPNKAFLQWVVKTRILPKQHEYVIVVKKPQMSVK